jgi:4-hydroxybenzoyl-CoA thioesterase
MLTNTRHVRIEWSDCDPAGIVFYPRYFEMFNDSAMALLERALGMKRGEYVKAYGFLDHPLTETRARFLRPTRYGDDVTIESILTVTGAASFQIEHRLRKGEELAVEGFETRIWMVRHADDHARMVPQPIPPQALARLSPA